MENLKQKTFIKVYFNNGCTTLIYNEKTTVEDLIRLVIKGRLSLNELRFKRCFSLRATKYSYVINDLDNLQLNEINKSLPGNTNKISNKILEAFWLRNNLTIKKWLKIISDDQGANSPASDYWKLQLRVRYLPNDLNEVKFKDPITFTYYYEQLKNDFIQLISPEITNVDQIPILLDLGCLEIRRSFQNMSANILDNMINYEYLEKEVGLKRFFPEHVLKQKSKSIKKSIIKCLKGYESLKELECMIKYLEKLIIVWNYNEEHFRCNLETLDGCMLDVTINFSNGIICKKLNSNQIMKSIKFDKIEKIHSEFIDNDKRGFIKLLSVENKELITLWFENVKEVDNMALLIDGYCSLVRNLNNSCWIRINDQMKQLNSSQDRKSDNQSSDDSVRFSDNMHFNSKLLMENEKSLINDLMSTDLKKFNNIQIESIVFHEKLGNGQFGEVFMGTYHKNAGSKIEVAIKKMQSSQANKDDYDSNEIFIKKFIYEAKIMQNFDHPHIIKLIGILTDGTFGIVMELAKFGQLRNYLQNNKDQIELITLLSYCCQLNSAMTYLESKKYVHRDIAARNILVVNHECIKLSDFGLSKEIDEIYLASKCKMPIKWMAPESINFGKFTHQSDVWMFGVCIWEILSYGCKPFLGIKNSDVKKLIEEKQRLNKPINCPEELYYIMLKCWEYDSNLRPTFTQLKEAINSIYISQKDNKLNSISKSLSNGSSLQSNSSISSTLSNPNNQNEQTNTVTVMRMMPLAKTYANKCDIEQLISLSQDLVAIPLSPLPPPKPIRNNSSRNVDYSPTRPTGNVSKHKSGNLTKTNISVPVSIEKDLNFNVNSFKNASDTNKKDFGEMKIQSRFNFISSSTAIKQISSSSKKINENQFDTYGKEDQITSPSKLGDYKWLEQSFQSMEITKTGKSLINKGNSSGCTNTPIKFSNSITSNSISLDLSRKDLLLRDQTLKFIQSISIFVKYLNGQDSGNLDNELRDIIISFQNLVEVIQCIDLDKSKKITEQLDELEISLNLMMNQFKSNHIEKVISLSLEMARKANEMFVSITKNGEC